MQCLVCIFEQRLPQMWLADVAEGVCARRRRREEIKGGKRSKEWSWRCLIKGCGRHSYATSGKRQARALMVTIVSLLRPVIRHPRYKTEALQDETRS
ncbi:hypothetical protein OIU84_017641 [Salix udensis]|uniref:Uncharacterized protein n=1 Tax=Salix udensis TaxID=889485 RepID=A0AAD6L3X9_9ROSI|nr:hypothetical protein OIU84_017641 [Salix udensis]